MPPALTLIVTSPLVVIDRMFMLPTISSRKMLPVADAVSALTIGLPPSMRRLAPEAPMTPERASRVIAPPRTRLLPGKAATMPFCARSVTASPEPNDRSSGVVTWLIFRSPVVSLMLI